MANYLTDDKNNTFAGILASAADNASVRMIETQMLDGSFTVQTIGCSATRVAIEFYCSTPTRRDLENCVNIGQPIKILWRDRIWTGLIADGGIKWQPVSRTQTRIQEKLQFEILVMEAMTR